MNDLKGSNQPEHFVIVHNKLWNQNESERFGVEVMESEGFLVDKLFLRTNSWRVALRDTMHVLRRVAKAKMAVVIPLFRLNTKTFLFFFAMKFISCKVYFFLDVQPNTGQASGNKGLLRQVLIHGKKFLSKIVYDRIKILCPIEGILINGRFAEDLAVLVCPPSSSKTILIPSHSFDYERAKFRSHGLKGVANLEVHGKKFVVFLDQALECHPDFALNGTAPPVGVEYLEALNNFFSDIKTYFGFEVVVAAHPKRSNHRAFGDVLCVTGETADLVAGSEFVIAHYSTAINLAVLHKKPILIASTAELSRVAWTKAALKAHADALGVRVYELTSESELSNLPLSSQSNNAVYEENYVRHPNSPELCWWQILLKYQRESENE